MNIFFLSQIISREGDSISTTRSWRFWTIYTIATHWLIVIIKAEINLDN